MSLKSIAYVYPFVNTFFQLFCPLPFLRVSGIVSPMKTDALDFDLPPRLIAQRPAERRDDARLLVLRRADGSIGTDVFRNITTYLDKGDCLVTNDTRVIRARLHAVKATGGRIEIFLLHENSPGEWTALVRPSARVAPGATVTVAGALRAEIGDLLPDGRRAVRFEVDDVIGALEQVGEIPLPPYIHRDQQDPADGERYQTIYAASPGAVAAPTAGLHYTPEVLAALEARGIRRAALTLHVGYGTFRPITADTLEEHRVDPEEYTFPEAAAQTLNETRAAGGRVMAVGTTSTRVLESSFRGGCYVPGAGQADLYIYPPYTFRAVDVLQTNFHLPRSSLLALVCAFAGVDLVMEAYQYAVREQFRFYSYGDAMLIL